MIDVGASIYILPEPGRTIPARSLLIEMANDVVCEFAERYLLSKGKGHKIAFKTEAALSPDHLVVRYRTVEAAIRRLSGKPTLLDLSVGNLFVYACNEAYEPIHVANEPKYAHWVRNVSQIPLTDHIRLVEQFIEDLMDSGWDLKKALLTFEKILPPIVKNGSGTHLLPIGKFISFVRHPISVGELGYDFGVVGSDVPIVDKVADQVQSLLDELFHWAGRRKPAVQRLRRISPLAINLVLIDDGMDFDTMPDFRNTVREAEATGIRFKLSKYSTLKNKWALRNLVYDMFIISGGKPWMPAQAQPAFCCMDAGHHTGQRKSRWVKVESDENQDIVQVRVYDTDLAEHIPANLLNEIWPSHEKAIICRDGKLSQEKSRMMGRVSTESRKLIESKKSPKAILWRKIGGKFYPAEFGDMVIDDHGDALLQTTPQNINDYVHPIRLTIQEGEPIELATAFLHQHAIPGLSLFKMSKLPGALYFADLASKLTNDGWPKAVGRGFKIPQIVP